MSIGDKSNSEEFVSMIKQYRQSILLASVGAYLHNLGKVSQEFHLQQEQKLICKYPKLKKQDPDPYYDYQHIIGILLKDIGEKELDFVPKNFTEERNITLKVFSKELQKKLKTEIPKLPAPFNDRIYRLGDFIEYLGQNSYSWGKIYSKEGINEESENSEKSESQSEYTQFNIESIFNSSSLLTHLMNRCHDGASGGEKNQLYCAKQIAGQDLFIATPFGYETKNSPAGFHRYDCRRVWVENIISKYIGTGDNEFSLQTCINRLKITFCKALADSQRPFNNITVHDIGHTGMALLKSGIWSLQGQEWTHDDFWRKTLNWRILRFGLDGLDYLADTVTIADLLIRRDKLKDYLNEAQILLEETYPVATEVYRDENGSIMVFPDWAENSPEYQNIKSLYQEIDNNNSEEAKLNSLFGIKTAMEVSDKPFVSHPRDTENTGLSFIGSNIKNLILSPAEAEPDLTVYTSQNEVNNDICPYCGIRFVGSGSPEHDINNQAKVRRMCAVCMQESSGRAKKWWVEAKKDKSTTIWLNEAADDNGRIALIIGRLHFNCFMECDYLPGCKGNNSEKKDIEFMYKADAFARSRRIWDCCREFWQDVEEKVIEKCLQNKEQKLKGRLMLSGKYIMDQGTKKEELKQYNAYELHCGEMRLDAMWTGDKFVLLENLSRLEKQYKMDSSIDKWFSEKIKECEIYIPGGYASKRKRIGRYKLNSAEFNTAYSPVISILAEPRTFMILVPADQAVKIAANIKEKYETEMGKVRSRLPISLGIVFANYYTPLRAIMDAGQRMLKRPAVLRSWTVSEVSKEELENKGSRVVKLKLDTGEMHQKAEWEISTRLGGEDVKDEWYPFLMLNENNEDDADESAGTLKPSLKLNDIKIKRMCHVNDIKEGHKIWVYPSTFDFEYLDEAGTRFEIAYDENGQRFSSDRSQRPYLLEEMKQIEEIGDIFKSGALSRNQIYGLRDVITSKRSEWEDKTVLKRYCYDMLATAQWEKTKQGNQKNEESPYLGQQDKENCEIFWESWSQYAVNGMLEDAILLYMQVLRVNLSEKERGK